MNVTPSRTDCPPDLAIDLAHFASGLDPTICDPAVVDAAKANIFDTLACALAGSSAKAVPEIVGLVRDWAGAPQADLMVLGGRYPAHHVAWANSVMCHARDYDDTHDAAILHAGVSVVPAALAACQLRGDASGADMIAGVIAGLEVMCRLGTATKLDLIESGFIYSSLMGYFGATAAAGRALALSKAEMAQAFGIVYSSAAGNHQVTRDASLMKRTQPGLAAQAAIVAIQLARKGIRGAQNVFEGADGFFRVYLRGEVDGAMVRAGLGEHYEMLNLSYKPYPCCRDTHSAIDAILALRATHGRDPAEIDFISVGTTAGGYQMVCVPEAIRLAPKTIVEAQFSIPYTVAAAWIDGRVGIGHFSDEGMGREDILALSARVRPYIDEEIERDWSRFVPPAKVTIHFRDGSFAHGRVDYAKGHPANPMTQAEFIAKASDCLTFAAEAMPQDTISTLFEAIDGLEQAQAVDAVIAAMTGTPCPPGPGRRLPATA
ncbi:MmgE/PrpD family protein [Sphingobium sp. H39-3-25]|uniref:MmgE/PrpD family protein n=1 Tax=Sphingobium arseniciresistens TaxID=3030834 RepID=UPI0023B9650D|nr:MmgE/PrpD family protein [Sphingobium arseniciresistens]